MTAPLFYTGPGALQRCVPGDLVTLDGAEGRHAATVHRLTAGEPVQLADGSGTLVLGRVDATDRDRLTVRVGEVTRQDPPGLTFVLVQALAKGERDLQAVEAATELGVDAVVPWQAERSIVQWRGERALKAHRKWGGRTLAAAKQSRRAIVPQVRPLVDRRGLADLVRASSATLLLHEEATDPLTDAVLPAGGEVLLVVGPEGGITESEHRELTDAGARPVRLGPTVLRSAHAGPAALAILLASHRW